MFTMCFRCPPGCLYPVHVTHQAVGSGPCNLRRVSELLCSALLISLPAAVPLNVIEFSLVA